MKALVLAPQPFYSPRGTPLSVYHRTRVLAELGVQVDLLTYGQGSDVVMPGVRIVRIPNVPFFGKIPVGPSKRKILLDALLFLYALGMLVVRRYDIVHAHEEAVFFSVLFKKLFGYKLIYDMHSSLPQQLTNFSFTKSPFLIGAFERWEDRALTSSDAVITICPELERYAVPRMPAPDRHFLIENTLLDEVVLKHPPKASSSGLATSIPTDGKRILYAGTFEPYQGLDMLLTAFASVSKQSPEATLVLVGGSPEQGAKLKEQARELGIANRCHFTGQVSQGEARTILRSVDIVVSPRCRGTNTPLKIYEILASGVPLVATNILSHTQVLDDDVCILVDPDPESFAKGLAAALSDDELCRRLARSARRLYDERYAAEIYRQKMSDLLALLRGRREELEETQEPRAPTTTSNDRAPALAGSSVEPS